MLEQVKLAVLKFYKVDSNDKAWKSWLQLPGALRSRVCAANAHMRPAGGAAGVAPELGFAGRGSLWPCTSTAITVAP